MNAIQSPDRRTQSERTEISDQCMFDATIRLVVERGPAATSLKDVGVLAGYSRGLASNRFGSKDNLFGFTLRRLGDIWLTQLTAATSGHIGLDAVHKALDQHYLFCLEAPDYVRTFYKLWFESVNASAELSDVIKSIHARRHQDVVTWIQSDSDLSSAVRQRADHIAAQFGASVIGIVYYWLANPTDLEQTKTLHDGLKETMTQLLTRQE